MTPPRKLSRRRVLLGIPAVAVAARFAAPAAPAQALKKKPECVADLIRPS
ncbi:hypothetical protein [Kribbella monticola]|nr:hypothetical protein [Kribbella monticola]